MLSLNPGGDNGLSVVREDDFAVACGAVTGVTSARAYAAVSTILDTGCRIDEVLSARVHDFDFDSLLLTVVGKGY